VAIILVTQFNSFYSTFLILSAVVMSTVGVLLGLLVTNQAFGIVMTGVGVISLAGIVVANNIILIDTYDQLKKVISSPRNAILLTCAQRLRPVMLTTVTTIIGVVPMVFQVSIDFAARDVTIGAPSTQWWVQLSTAIAFGLTFATILTLIVTPSALMARENVRAWRARRRARRDGGQRTGQDQGWPEPPIAEAAE
jgi:multidrug efflux pump